ncbi:MAG TPA: hypothetical protein VJ464_14870 [Blastocatellia bacterium]|nr:hypothetical protein [Blastocatellia bacterium]
MNQPQEISLSEWAEIIQVPEVRESWGLNDESPEEFASNVYGVKFDFVSGSPGYIGDLYILQGDVLTGKVPLILGRYDGKLQPVYDDQIS